MKIDRSRFLALTASIGVSAASCGGSDVPIARIQVPPPAGPAPSTDAGAPVVTRDEEPPPPKPPEKEVCPENAIGSLAACNTWKIDPTCESGGPLGECTSLLDADGFQPRVAEAIASCMTKKPVTRATGCKHPDMHKCIRDAVDTVCVDPSIKAQCETLVDACKARHARLTFTVDQCSKIATSTRGDLRRWALEAMGGFNNGAPMAEGCTLQYVTVYQPWPANWWTGK